MPRDIDDDPEELLLNSIESLKKRLQTTQKKGDLSAESSLCSRLAQLHFQLNKFREAFEYGLCAFQISEHLENWEQAVRDSALIVRILMKVGLMERAEEWMTNILNIGGSVEGDFKLKRTALIEYSEISLNCRAIESIARQKYLDAVKHVQTALTLLQQENNNNNNNSAHLNSTIECKILLGRLYGRLGNRLAFDLLNQSVRLSDTLQSPLLQLKSRLALAEHLTNSLKEYRAAFDLAKETVDLFKKDGENAKFKPRVRVYSEILLIAGRCLRHLEDYSFAMTNLQLSLGKTARKRNNQSIFNYILYFALEQAGLVMAESELIEEIQKEMKAVIGAREAQDELILLERGRRNGSKVIKMAELYERMEKWQLALDCYKEKENPSSNQLLRMAGVCEKLNREREAFEFYDRIRRENDCKSDDYWKAVLGILRALNSRDRVESLTREIQRGLGSASLDQQLKVNSALALFYLDELDDQEQYGHFYTECLNLSVAKAMLSESELLKKEIIEDERSISYFSHRKLSSTASRLLGSGMVMTKRTRKAKGLDLKCARGRKSTVIGEKETKNKGNRVLIYEGESEEDLKDFVVNEGEEEDDDNEPLSQVEASCKRLKLTDTAATKTNKKGKSKSSIVISDDDDDGEENDNLLQQEMMFTPTSYNNNTNTTKSRNLNIFDDEMDGIDFNPPTTTIDWDDRMSIKSFASQSATGTGGAFSFISQSQIMKPTICVNIRVDDQVNLKIPMDRTLSVQALIEETNRRVKLVCGDRGGGRIIEGLITKEDALLFPLDKIGDVLVDGDQLSVKKSISSRNPSNNINSSHVTTLSPWDQIIGLLEEKIQLQRGLGNDRIIKFLEKCKNRIIPVKTQNFLELINLDFSGLGIDSDIWSHHLRQLLLMICNTCRGTSLRLDLSRNFLNEQDLRPSDFPSNISELNLSWNLIVNVASLEFPANLKVLRLTGNLIDGESIKLLLKQKNRMWMGSLEGLEMAWIPLIEIDEDIDYFGGLPLLLPALKSLSLSLPDDYKRQSRFLQSLARCQDDYCIIESLSFPGVNWQPTTDDSAVSFLFDQLASLPYLKCLDLTGCGGFENKVIIQSLITLLLRTSSLEHLILDETDLSVEGFGDLLEMGLSRNFSIRRLDLKNNDNLGGGSESMRMMISCRLDSRSKLQVIGTEFGDITCKCK